MHYRRVLHVVGLAVLLVAGAMSVPLGVAILMDADGDAAWSFFYAMCAGGALGCGFMMIGERARQGISRRDGVLIVALSWIAAAFVAGLPYLFSGVIPSLVGANFEAMSGLTTTGASVLENIETAPTGEAMPPSILFWRCMTNWIGGVGIVVLFVALLPALGVGGKVLLNFEVPGVGDKGFMPHVRQTATTLWKIYLILSAALVVALMVAGLDLYHAVCHAFATMATGGFSPHNASVGEYESGHVHVIITVFMFLAGVNFTLYFALANRNWRSLVENREFRVYCGIMLFAIITVSIDLANQGLFSGADAARHGAFQVVSIGTTTGFATSNTDVWPAYSKIVLVTLMFIGGSAGSTAGGLKVIRVIILVKFMLRQLVLQIRPRSVERMKIGGHGVDEELIRLVLGMALLFLAGFAFGAISLAAMGVDLTTAMSASIATIGNVGPGFGSVGSTGNYSQIPPMGQVILTGLMLVGRLEIFTALSLLVPALWRD